MRTSCRVDAPACISTKKVIDETGKVRGTCVPGQCRILRCLHEAHRCDVNQRFARAGALRDTMCWAYMCPGFVSMYVHLVCVMPYWARVVVDWASRASTPRSFEALASARATCCTRYCHHDMMCCKHWTARTLAQCMTPARGAVKRPTVAAVCSISHADWPMQRSPSS